MPIKTWTSGEVLTAAHVDTYLMQQAHIICTSSTRPSSPVEGMHIWETDTEKGYVYSSSAWQFKEAYASVQFARKTTDETVNNSITLQLDDQLAVVVPPLARYLVELFIVYNSSTVADLQIGLDQGPGNWASMAPGTGQTNKDSSTISVRAFSPDPVAGFGSDAAFRARGAMGYNSSASSVTVTFSWAQNTAEASNTTVKAGSYIFLRILDD